MAAEPQGDRFEESSISGTMTSHDLGVSENSVPLNPMVNDHYPY